MSGRFEGENFFPLPGMENGIIRVSKRVVYFTLFTVFLVDGENY